MKTAKKTPGERQRIKKALDAVQSAKRHLAEARTYFPSAAALVRLEAELQAQLTMTGPASFPFGANVEPCALRFTGPFETPAASGTTPLPFGNTLMTLHDSQMFSVPLAQVTALECWHKNKLVLDGPAAKCGCQATSVHPKSCAECGAVEGTLHRDHCSRRLKRKH